MRRITEFMLDTGKKLWKEENVVDQNVFLPRPTMFSLLELGLIVPYLKSSSADSLNFKFKI